MNSPVLEQFTPKLISQLREGYGTADLRADAIAGLTVAIVALPLSMAIAITSGLPPERGLYTAIIGGFIISLLGGSRFQIGGPAGAFIVLIAAIVGRHGYDGLVLATFMAGVMMMLIGSFPSRCSWDSRLASLSSSSPARSGSCSASTSCRSPQPCCQNSPPSGMPSAQPSR
jgi:Sulfate permease family